MLIIDVCCTQRASPTVGVSAFTTKILQSHYLLLGHPAYLEYFSSLSIKRACSWDLFWIGWCVMLITYRYHGKLTTFLFKEGFLSCFHTKEVIIHCLKSICGCATTHCVIFKTVGKVGRSYHNSTLSWNSCVSQNEAETCSEGHTYDPFLQQISFPMAIQQRSSNRSNMVITTQIKYVSYRNTT